MRKREHKEGDPVQVPLCAAPEIRAVDPGYCDTPNNSRECRSLNEFREFRQPKAGNVPAPVFVRLADRWSRGVAIGAHSDDFDAPAADVRITGVTVRLESGSVLDVGAHDAIRWEKVRP